MDEKVKVILSVYILNSDEYIEHLSSPMNFYFGSC